MHPQRTTHVWLAFLAVAGASASESAADERAKLDAENAAALCAALPKIVPAGWQFANRLKVTPSVSREPRLMFVIESTTPLPFEHIEISAPGLSGDEPEPPPALERVAIRLVTMPYLSPAERAAAADRNERSHRQRLDFDRQYLKDIEYASKRPRPIPPWDYALQNADPRQQELLRQYIFLWLRTEPALLPSHHYRTLAFKMETSPWGTIQDEQKMKQYQQVLAALQQIVVPYDSPASGEFVGE